MGSMTLEQLKAKARENQIELPAKPTKGWIMRMLRTATAGADQDIMTFGRYKHWEYQSVPQGYRDWAEREVAANTNASEDLRRFAHWCASKRAPTTTTTSGYTGVDPETDPVIPLPDTASSTGWSMVPPISDPGRASTTPLPPTPRNERNVVVPKPKAKTPESRGIKMGHRGPPEELTRWTTERPSPMEADVGAEALEEIEALEARLAILKREHGLGTRRP